MSKIQSVNYQHQPKSAPKHGNYVATQSFGIGLSDLPKKAKDILTDGVGVEIDNRTFLGKRFKWLANYKGEVQNQLINALFTATLAPLVIRYSPFVKQDEKTRAYTAWRQPISAIIAVTGGVGMTIGINRFMDNLYHKGYFKTIDLRLQPNRSYIKRFYRKENKESIFSSVWNFILAKENPKFEKYKKDVEEQRLELFSRLISENPDAIKLDGSTIKVGQEDLLAKHHIKTPIFETQEALDKYLKANNLHNRKFNDFLADRFKFEFYETGELKPNITKRKLSEIKAMDFLKEMGLIEEGKVTENELIRILNVFQQDKRVNEYAKVAHSSRKDAGKLLEIHGKLETRASHMRMGEEFGKAEKVTLGQFFHQLSYYLTKDNKNDKTIQELADKPMIKVLDELAEHFRGKMKGFNDKITTKEFAENILQNSIKRMTENAKNYKNYAGIAFNLITTAITCTILNWAYPRIMDKFFPNLSKSDKKPEAVKGGNK